MNEGKLFEQFPPVTTAEWIEKIRSDLKGADYGRKMIWRTGEGYEVKPFYRAEDIENLRYTGSLPGDFPYIRGIKTHNNAWKIRENVEVSDYRSANRKALEIQVKGVNSLGFRIIDPESVNEKNFEILLHDIHIECIEINFHCDGKAKEILDILKAVVEGRGLCVSDIHGAIETDPLGRLMLNGTLCIPVEHGFGYLASLTGAAEVFPNLRTIHLNASHFNNAGAESAMELGFGMAMGSEYLAQLSDRGIDPGYAASKIRFSFGLGSGYFQEIAKLRAARLLWSAVTNAFGTGNSGGRKIDIHCVTGEWNKTVYDPWVNMIRTQTEAMSAILGGTDSLTVQPFDITFKESDEFSRRIARNQQLILREESYFDKVADPSAGSYYIENLTRMIAESAWKLFVQTEENGGFLASLRSGFIQSALADTALRRKNEIATGERTFVGTNKYPDTAGHLPSAADLALIFRPGPEKADDVIEPIRLCRGTEDFERARIAAERAEKVPVVFILTIGDPIMRKARAQFASGFFGCAGYRIIDNPGFSSTEEAIISALTSEPDIVVICSSDEEYLNHVPEIFSRLKDKAVVVVAGYPDAAGKLKECGIDLFINIRSDVPRILSYFNQRLGIREI